MDLEDQHVIMITSIDDAWTWKFVSGGEHGVVSDADGICATRDEAVHDALVAHPKVKIVDVDNPRASY